MEIPTFLPGGLGFTIIVVTFLCIVAMVIACLVLKDSVKKTQGFASFARKVLLGLSGIMLTASVVFMIYWLTSWTYVNGVVLGQESSYKPGWYCLDEDVEELAASGATNLSSENDFSSDVLKLNVRYRIDEPKDFVRLKDVFVRDGSSNESALKEYLREKLADVLVDPRVENEVLTVALEQLVKDFESIGVLISFSVERTRTEHLYIDSESALTSDEFAENLNDVSAFEDQPQASE